MFTIQELAEITKGRISWYEGRGFEVGGISIDSRTLKKGEAFVAIRGRRFNGHDFIDKAVAKGAACIIKEYSFQTKENRLPIIEVRDTIKALGEIARAHRLKMSIPLVAITGSNGKTSAKEMIARVLGQRYNVLKNEGTKNNHIGVPLTLLQLNHSYEAAVLELGTNNFGEIKNLSSIALPNIGIVTNIGKAHLQAFQNLYGVCREKMSLLKNLQRPRIVLLNGDDQFLKSRLPGLKSNYFIATFGLKRRNDFFAEKISIKRRKISFCANGKHKLTLNTLGRKNVYNALAAIAIGRLFGVSYREISTALAKFSFPEGRLKLVRDDGRLIIDDSYNSNPNSLLEALEVLKNFKIKGRKIFIMGDMLELGRDSEKLHIDVGDKLGAVCDILITVGKFSRLAALQAKKKGFDPESIFICRDRFQARKVLSERIPLKKDDLILIKGSRSMKMEEVYR